MKVQNLTPIVQCLASRADREATIFSRATGASGARRWQLLALAFGWWALAALGAETSLVSLVDPLQGTDDPPNYSHGNEYPAIALPFPMNVWAPYTEPENNFLFYQYRHNQIRGLRQTHEPSRWICDYANFSLMPVSGKSRN